MSNTPTPRLRPPKAIVARAKRAAPSRLVPLTDGAAIFDGLKPVGPMFARVLERARPQ